MINPLRILFFSTVLLMVSHANAIASQRQSTKQSKQLAAQCAAGLRSISEDAARAHVYFLADDLLEGRRAGQRGAQIAKQYIISQIREAGLKPFASDAFEQPFEACARQTLKRMGRFYVEADSIERFKTTVHQTLNLSNVLAVVPGKKADEFVVVGAHLDHEGIYPDVEGDNIYNGADDNASGVSAVLQIMKAFAVSGAQPERTIVFAFWDGEEFGLLGSKYFTQTFRDINRIKGYLNFDMVGGNNRSDDPSYFVYFYTEAHPAMGDWLRNDISKHGFALNPDIRSWDNPIGGSDQGSFARYGVPIVWYHTDAQPHYNMPSDEPQTINYPKLTDISRAAFLTAWHLANDCF